MPESGNVKNDTVIDVDARKRMKKLKRMITFVGAAMIGLFIFLNSFYTLESNQNAVILRFGRVAQVVTVDGPHFKMPFIDRVDKVDMKIRSMEYGYTTQTPGTETTQSVTSPNENEATVIVDAANNNASIALIEIIIQYEVTDPVEYLFNVDDVVGTLRLALEDSVRQGVQSMTLDEAKSNKELIDDAVFKSLQKKMDSYNAGINIVLVGTQNVRFLDNVEIAYQEKENANQYKNGKQEDSERYYNTVLPQANAEATQLIEQANGYKAETVANANAAVAEFNALYEQYKTNPDIMREQYYIQAMTEFLSNNKIVVDLSGTGEVYKFYNFNDSDLVKEQISGGTSTGTNP